MKQLYWQTYGEGKHDIVMLHGWGLNAEVWHDIKMRMGSHFRLHLVDLPGYGRSHEFGPLSLDELIACLMQVAPEKACWFGWSLGGLLATKAALDYPERVDAVITVASSPCFRRQDDWPGIDNRLLQQFKQQLSDDFSRTLERFFALQTMGSGSARQDTRQLKDAIANQPHPSLSVLQAGLDLLQDTDLRRQLVNITCPALRIYGALDSLVPQKTAKHVDIAWPHSQSVVIPHAAHAPFISHPAVCGDEIMAFLCRLR